MSEDLKVSIYVSDGAGIRVQVFTCMQTLTCACVFMCMYAHTQAWCTCMCMHKAHERAHVHLGVMCVGAGVHVCAHCVHLGVSGTFPNQALGREIAQGP